MRLIDTAVAMALLALAVNAPAQAGALRAPDGFSAAIAVKQKPKALQCPAAPAPFTATLDFPSKYEGSGKARDQVNEAADQRYRKLIQPITDMEKGATKIVDKALDGQSGALDCALAWYGSWAQAGALLGPSANHTGKSMRKWALGSLSGAWLRLKFSSSQPLAAHAEQARQIESWLGRVADQVTQEWSAGDPLDKINNHYYWAAWSVMATSIVTDRRDLFDWSTQMYGVFTRQVDAEGYLPNEIKRQTRAAGYQLYAVTPLAMVAAFGKANGVDLAGQGDAALSRAVGRALSVYDDPGAYERKTGKRQILEGADEQRSKMAWLEPYCWTVSCQGVAARKLQELRPMKNSRLGGDLTRVFRSSGGGA